MVLKADAAIGLANRFEVVVDSINLGSWQKCTGLSVEFKPLKIIEGGNYEHEIILPGQVLYKDITLARAMTVDDSPRVQSWLSQKATSYGPSHADITLYDHKLIAVNKWTLRNVYPISWKSPDLDAGTGKFAVEVLTLAHEGFL